MGGYIILRATVLHFADTAAPTSSSFLGRLVETAQAFSFYISRLFLPKNLHMEQTLADASPVSALVGLLLLAGMVVVLVLSLRRNNRLLALPIAWFIASWLPISGIFPLNAPMAEHWMYVPMAGFWWAVLAVVALLAANATLQKAAVLGFVMLAIFFGVRTAQRNEDWHSNETIFTATLRENPETIRVHYNLAVAYEDIVKNLPAARRHYERALALYAAQKQPTTDGTQYLVAEEMEIHLSLGRVFLELHEFDDAVQHFGLLTQALSPQEQPEMLAQACLGMGRSLLALGEFAAASNYLGRAVELAPPLAPEAQALLEGTSALLS
jgi:tetratricopeptide (TPR) repeat protein